jgi:hypothetical protein
MESSDLVPDRNTAMTDRRFLPPWDIEEHHPSCFIARDNNGQALSYVYYETEPGRRTAANLLRRDEARRIAAKHAGVAHSAAVLVAVERDRTRGLNRR